MASSHGDGTSSLQCQVERPGGGQPVEGLDPDSPVHMCGTPRERGQETARLPFLRATSL